MGQVIGEELSSSGTMQSCCNPEGAAAVKRKKKAQKSAMEDYTLILDNLESAINLQDAHSVMSVRSALQTYEEALRAKQCGEFWVDLSDCTEWQALCERRRWIETHGELMRIETACSNG